MHAWVRRSSDFWWLSLLNKDRRDSTRVRYVETVAGDAAFSCWVLFRVRDMLPNPGSPLLRLRGEPEVTGKVRRRAIRGDHRGIGQSKPRTRRPSAPWGSSVLGARRPVPPCPQIKKRTTKGPEKQGDRLKSITAVLFVCLLLCTPMIRTPGCTIAFFHSL